MSHTFWLWIGETALSASQREEGTTCFCGLIICNITKNISLYINANDLVNT